ncbi:hypothetical protein D3C76_1476010 [compost metagenome]
MGGLVGVQSSRFCCNHAAAKITGIPQMFLETLDVCPSAFSIRINRINIAAQNSDLDSAACKLVPNFIRQSRTEFAVRRVNIR